AIKGRRVVGPAVVALEQERHEFLRPRQAADVGGEDLRHGLLRFVGVTYKYVATGHGGARRGARTVHKETGASISDIGAPTAPIEGLEHELGVQQDIHQIRRVQYTYGYFIDKSQYNEVVDLFSDQSEVWFLGGIYKGKAGVRRLYIENFQTRFTQGHNGPRYGWLLDHPQMQMVIDVAPDRSTAQVRGRSMMQAGLHESATGQQRAWWEGGIYENEYVRESGIWKIKALRYYPFWHGSFAEGWPK